jgi:signal peptidase
MSTHERPMSSTAGRRVARRYRRTLVLSGWILFFAALVVLWPVRFGGFMGITVVSGHSMDGTYSTGDVVFTWHHQTYQPGEVIVYRITDQSIATGLRVVHRVQSVNADGTYTTRGDNNDGIDPWRPRAADVDGAVFLRLPQIGRPLHLIFSPLVLLLLAAAVTAWAVYFFVLGGDPEDDPAPQPDLAPAPAPAPALQPAPVAARSLAVRR